MTERFKKQLKDYSDGKLSSAEQAEVEAELAKLEVYQQFVDEELQEDHKRTGPETTRSLELNPKKAKQMLKKGKRRVGYWSVGTVIGMLMLFAMLNSIFTSVFYTTGDEERLRAYSNVVQTAIAITSPNIDVNLNSHYTGILGVKYFGNTIKQIGGKREIVGEYSQNFRLNQMIGPGSDSYRVIHNQLNVFFYTPEGNVLDSNESEWSRLDKLPEGTVAEMYVSLDQYYKPEDVAALFRGIQFQLLWHAVDTGQPYSKIDNHPVMKPIGYPSYPLYRLEDGQLKNDDFLSTLELLLEYKSITRSVVSPKKISETLEYVQQNGIRIYGVVITGPTKELLKLQKASFVKQVRIGEVRLWNWE